MVPSELSPHALPRLCQEARFERVLITAPRTAAATAPITRNSYSRLGAAGRCGKIAAVKRNLLVYTSFVGLSLLIVAGILQVAPLLLPEAPIAGPIAVEGPSGLFSQMLEHARSPLRAADRPACRHRLAAARLRADRGASRATAGDRRDRGRHAARAVAARLDRARGQRGSVPAESLADPAAAQPGRCAAVHVRRRRGARRRRTCAARRKRPWRSATSASSSRSCWASLLVARALSRLRTCRRAVPRLRPVPGHRDEHHRVSRSWRASWKSAA